MQKQPSVPVLTFHRNGRNLHISLQSEPDTADIISMSSVLNQYADKSGRLFVDVRSLKESINQKTVVSLQKAFKASDIPAQSIYFKGPMGFTLASNGNRVLIVRSKDEMKNSPMAAAAQKRFVKRPHTCACGGKCGDKCCQVTGGPCCSKRGHDHKVANDA